MASALATASTDTARGNPANGEWLAGPPRTTRSAPPASAIMSASSRPRRTSNDVRTRRRAAADSRAWRPAASRARSACLKRPVAAGRRPEKTIPGRPASAYSANRAKSSSSIIKPVNSAWSRAARSATRSTAARLPTAASSATKMRRRGGCSDDGATAFTARPCRPGRFGDGPAGRFRVPIGAAAP